VPFGECAAQSFTFTSVQKNAPQHSGVYGLSNAREWIFIGESGDIRAALLEHLRAGSILTRNPTGFMFELCPASGRATRCNELIREFKPFCNGR
jgi:hypothetical protein